MDAARQLGRSTASVELQGEEAHVAMAVWLLNATTSRAPPPNLGGWLKALPTSLDCTIEWSESELAHLQASTARTRAGQLRRWVDAEHARLFPASGAGTWHPSHAQFRWALCAVWSRSFHLEGGHWRVLAPGADFFDDAVAPAEVAAKLELIEDRAADSTSCTSPADCGHAVDAADSAADADAADANAANAAEDSGADSGSGDGDGGSMGESVSIVFRSTRALAAGEAVEIDYGGRPNAQLVTTHGFAIQGNPHESIPLSLAPSESDPLGPVKRKHAHAHAHPHARTHARPHVPTCPRAHVPNILMLVPTYPCPVIPVPTHVAMDISCTFTLACACIGEKKISSAGNLRRPPHALNPHPRSTCAPHARPLISIDNTTFTAVVVASHLHR